MNNTDINKRKRFQVGQQVELHLLIQRVVNLLLVLVKTKYNNGEYRIEVKEGTLILNLISYFKINFDIYFDFIIY